MACFDPDDAEGPAAVEAFGGVGTGGQLPLPAGARHTLEQIAAALGVTEALLRRPAGAEANPEGARLAEASELLQAFIRIQDPDARRRCVAFVQRAALSPRAT